MKKLLKVLVMGLIGAFVLIAAMFWHYDRADLMIKEFEQIKAVFGVPNALYRLGYMHRYGTDMPANQEIALRYLTRAARKGHIRAQSLLAMMHFRGKGTPPDPIRGCAWMMLAHYQAVLPEDRNFCTQGLRVLQGEMSPEDVARAKELCISLHKQIFPTESQQREQISPDGK